ncbi:MAG: hypothetical protein Harvfovirus3_56 [Harvfovirus sp.]|uniref:Uncharacterized protein n=1 Tax=Harvfovirus sp. TaxID=2487768 RepID=A0A3G5A345_9VIRU|nr:MAG: hypothetical protein Harvfovirus3_56 [Harvfovirus sp.]
MRNNNDVPYPQIINKNCESVSNCLKQINSDPETTEGNIEFRFLGPFPPPFITIKQGELVPFNTTRKPSVLLQDGDGGIVSLPRRFTIFDYITDQSAELYFTKAHFDGEVTPSFTLQSVTKIDGTTIINWEVPNRPTGVTWEEERSHEIFFDIPSIDKNETYDGDYLQIVQNKDSPLFVNPDFGGLGITFKYRGTIITSEST